MPSSFEHLLLVREASYGVPVASPVAGTDSFYVRLNDSNAFSVIDNPQIQEIAYGGGFATTAEYLSDYTEVRGALKTPLYPSQAQFFLDWSLGRINAGQTSPWTTTEPPGDLPSVSAYHAVQRSDGSIKRTRYPGCKVGAFRIEASRGSPVWTMTLDITAQKYVGNTFDASTDPDVTEFPDPTEASYAVGPYLFTHSAGGLLLGTGAGTVRSQYESLALAVANSLDARPFESRFLQVCAFRGRKSTLDAALRLKATPDDNAAYEVLAAETVKLTLTSGAHTLVLDYKGNNYISARARDLPLGKVFMRTLTLTNAFSVSAATDIAYSTT